MGSGSASELKIRDQGGMAQGSTLDGDRENAVGYDALKPAEQ